MKKTQNAVSIRDISRLCGVSVATVSRVLNRNGRFSKETEKKVLAAVERQHYAPNETARRLRTQKQDFIAVFVPDITNEFFAGIFQQLQQLLLMNGYLALLCNTSEDSAIQKQYLNQLGVVNLAGIIFVSGDAGTQTQSAIRGIPTLYIDRAPQNEAPDRVTIVESDHRGGAALAVDEMARKDCRRIACLRSAQPISTHDERQEGYEHELRRLGLETAPELVIRAENVSVEAARRAVWEAWTGPARFDGLFCVTDQLAAGAIEALKAASLRIPEQVKVVGFDDTTLARIASPPITTVRQDTDALSRTAAEIMIRLIRGEAMNVRRYEIGVKLVCRNTT